MRYVSLPDESVVTHEADREEVTGMTWHLDGGQQVVDDLGGVLRVWQGETLVAEYKPGEWRSVSERPPHHMVAANQRDFC